MSFGENPDAVNYLETAIRDPDNGARYVLIFAKSKAQTPHELRTVAEAKLVRAREDAQAANTAAVQKLLRAPRPGKQDSFDAGVKAALDESGRPTSPPCPNKTAGQVPFCWTKGVLPRIYSRVGAPLPVIGCVQQYTILCHDNRQGVRETVPQRTTFSRAATAALAIALSTGITAGAVVLAAPASASVTQAPLSAADTAKRQHITNTFNKMNAFRASKGMPPVRLGLDVSELLQEVVNDWDTDVYGPDSIINSSRVKGYSSFAYGEALLGEPDAWIQHLLADASKNVVGIATDATHVSMTTYAYRTVPTQTFDTAEAYFAYLDLPQLQGPEPKLLGTAAWGSTLTADPGVWPAGTKLEYRWLHTNAAGFTSLTGNTASANLIDDYATGNKVSVRVTATLPGKRAAILYSAMTAPIQNAVDVRNTRAPAITGPLEAGQALTVNPGIWDTGTVFTYVWLGSDGRPISGATSSTYTPPRAGQLSVQVTGSKPGLRSTSVISAPVNIIDINSKAPSQTFGDPWKPREGAPSVGEEFRELGSGNWLAGTTLTRAWTRDGKAIPGATGTSYKLTAADVGTRIALSVTGTRQGNKPRTVSAAPSEKIAALRPLVINSKAPVVVGTGLMGKPLTVNAGTWTAGTRLTYQWTVTHGPSTYPIAGATAASYTPTAQDEGGTVSVEVTGWKTGYTPLRTGGVGSPIKVAGVEVHKALVVTPAISGTAQTGKTLTSKVWNSGASLKYQWKRNGVAIPGATGASYKLTAGDLGRKITLTVTGTLTGFPTASATSGPSANVTQLPTQYNQIPTFSWPSFPPVVGQTIKMTSPGKWTAGAKLTYQWTRNGAPIAGATGTSYMIVAADAGKRLGVTVTGQTPDYAKAVFRDIDRPVRAR